MNETKPPAPTLAQLNINASIAARIDAFREKRLAAGVDLTRKAAAEMLLDQALTQHERLAGSAGVADGVH